MSPHLRSHARAAASSSPPSPSQSQAAAGAPQRTPVPSPSTSLLLGLGPASPDDGGLGAASPYLKSPTAAPPRRSLRLAGASGGSSPSTPSAQDGGSSGSGSGSGSGGSRTMTRRARAARLSASPPATTASTKAGSDGGGPGADAALAGSGFPGGAGRFSALRSGSRISNRWMEPGAGAIGEAGTWSLGGGQVHDEMLHRNAGKPRKRSRTILVRGVETEYVADTESESDEDRVKKPAAQVPTAPTGFDLNTPSMDVDVAEEGDLDDGSNAGIGGPLQAHSTLGMSIGGVIEQSVYPAGSPSRTEAMMYADMYVKEGLSTYSPRKEGKAKEKLVLGNNYSRSGANVGSPDTKGKGKMVVEDSLPSQSSSDEGPDFGQVDSKEIRSSSNSVPAFLETSRRKAAKERAIRLAPKFAFFKPDEDEHSEDEEEEELEPGPDPQDWPGPFATAARIYEEREEKLRARELNSSKQGKSANKAILWSPSKDRKNAQQAQAAPSLTSLCLNTLVEHSECIESLGGISEELKRRLLKLLCHSRKMNAHLLNELLCDSPTELHLSECSWLSEDDFEKTFRKCSTGSFQDLQLDISGRCMPDYILPATLAKVPNCMPLLRKISLKGNYRLSDKGLGTIISSAPSLSSLNLCECSLLTSSGIDILANKLHSVLRELYIDDCTNVEAMMILPSLKRINHLEVLSMSGIQSVCDKFVGELLHIHGSNMKGLAFAGCLKLTSSSIKTIGENCPQLTSLDLRNLNRLRDSSMRHLRNGCRLIRTLRLQRNTFSDEAVSRYLAESGGCLTELMLNNVEKVGDLTALAISRNCSVRLEALDLSFCRELTNEALGLIVDSCHSLKILKLFGCTQVTDFFLKGHSNTSVKIVGIEGNILEQMDNC